MGEAGTGEASPLMQLNRARPDGDLAGPSTDGVFDPERGETVVEPPGPGAGCWAGAPSVVWADGRYYLSYRIRRPRPERGVRTWVAVSSDGVRFEPVWTAARADFDSPSLERSSLVRVADDHWRLYVSYVDGTDGRWRVDLLEAAEPGGFRPAARQAVLTAATVGSEGVKDPWVYCRGGRWHMFASHAPPPARGADPARLHGSRDVYNTGLTRSLTGRAVSDDGRRWRWQGDVLTPRAGRWDAYATRLNSLLRADEGWLGYYDGCASVAQNYEERCGLVAGDGLGRWRLLGDGPLVGSPGGPGTVRYVETVQTSGWVRLYYEYTRGDGSHELRTSVLDVGDGSLP